VRSVYVVVPDGIDDPGRPSGGNVYDRRVCDGLPELGWSVHERLVPGPWPRPDQAARQALADVVAEIPDGAVVMADGLIASATPEVLVPEAGRVRLAVLVHLPRGHVRERAVLSAASAVIATSNWTRRWIVEEYSVPSDRVHVAEPGVDPAELAEGTTDGQELLCVGALTPNKGQDLLLTALGSLADLVWRCVLAGSTDRDREFVDRLHAQARASGVDDRVHVVGPLSGSRLAAAYAAADVLVLASRFETYGMVVTEALARGLPVVATDVGGMPEALRGGREGPLPGLLVRPGDPEALAAALRRWLGDAELRRHLRGAARARRDTLADWSATSARIGRVLTEVAR
jgi:glycosyltransferase involved in cell wall biosynthesis